MNAGLSVSLADMSVGAADLPLHQQSNLSQLMASLERGEKSLLQLIQDLEPFITQGDKTRNKAMDLLSYALIELPHLMLNQEEIKVLLEFFIAKLRDVVCVLPAIKSIYAILRYQNATIASSEKGREIIRLIFDGTSNANFHIPAYAQKVRHYAYKVYELLFEAKDWLPTQEFIAAVITGTEDEKDPRNLVVTFNLQTRCLQFPEEMISPFVEPIFEQFSLYYPIDFEPPKNNENFRITP